MMRTICAAHLAVEITNFFANLRYWSKVSEGAVVIAGVPIYNPSGKYMVKLKFNGVERRILVDDRLVGS